MSDWIIGVLLAVFIIVPCWLALSRRKELIRQIEAWSELAGRTGLTLDPNIYNAPKGIHHYPGLRGEYRGRSLVVKIIHDSDRFEPPNTLLSLDIQNCACCSLSIQAKTFHDFIHRVVYVPSGNPDFDRRFSVTGSPPEYMPRAIDLILRCDPRLLAWIMQNYPSIELKGDNLTCWQNGELPNVDDQIALLNLLCDLAELIEKVECESARKN